MIHRTTRLAAVVFPLALALVTTLALPHSLGAQETRVLVVGDSWAAGFWDNSTLRDTFSENGLPGVIEKGDVTAISGTTAAEWRQASMLQTITDELTANPTIDLVQLIVGGNDFLDNWSVALTALEEQMLFDQILADIEVVVDHVLGLGPQYRLALGGYDYPNFEDTLLNPFCFSIFNSMGQPTTLELNAALRVLSAQIESAIEARPRAEVVEHFGWMQMVHGFPGQGIAPFSLLPPGDPALPTPSAAMALLGFDCIHLTGAGYRVAGQNLWNDFYAKELIDAVFVGGFEAGTLDRWMTVVQ